MAAERRFEVEVEGAGAVSALLERPPGARWLCVLAHGAGAGMRHAFMAAMAGALAAADVATFRYQFPYMEAGRRAPDRAGVLEATVRAAVRAAAAAAPDLPLVAGGKSMGGRMTSRLAAREPLPGVIGLVLLGFPLHPAGRPGTERGDHLADVPLPMLFLQGTRDKLALPDLVRTSCAARPRATLHEVEGADHGFHVLKRSGRTDEEVRAELAATVREWLESLA